MPRTILLHLNAEVPDGDTRTADQIADAVRAALEVGSDNESVEGLTLDLVLAEEI